MKEIKDIAMWEETDSELAKYTIQKQNYEMEEAQELINYLGREKLKLQQRIDKAIEYLKDNACYENTISELFCDDLNYDNCMELLKILRGEE